MTTPPPPSPVQMSKVPSREDLFEPEPMFPEQRRLMKQEQAGCVIEPHQNKLFRHLSNVPPEEPVYYADDSSFTESESDVESSSSRKRYIEDTEEEIEIATKRQKIRHGGGDDNFIIRWLKNIVSWFQKLFDKKKN